MPEHVEIIPENNLQLDRKTSTILTRLYIAALTAVAILTITGQILIQTAIRNQLTDSNVINRAGKQRYMSQQICKLVLLIYNDLPHKEYYDKVQDLKSILNKWVVLHYALQYKNAIPDVKGNNSAETIALFKILNPRFIQMRKAVLTIIEINERPELFKKHPEILKEQITQVLEVEKSFLNIMDRIVLQYDKEAKDKVIFLKKVEFALFFLTMIILLLEGLFIFPPAVKMIRNTIKDLVTSENKTNDLAKKLMHTNKVLERSLKDLSDVNYALDNATILLKTDRHGRIIFINNKFCDITGYSREELIGEKFDKLNAHYHSESFFNVLWTSISEGKIWSGEIKNKAKNGTHFWMHTTIVPVLNDRKMPDLFLAIYNDVSQRFRQSIIEQKVRSVSIIEGQEKERRKIARELHDGLGQMLTALKFNIEGLKGAPTKLERQNLLEIRKFTLETIREVRRISFNLMPSVLSDFGIVPAVKHLTEQVSKHSGIAIIFEHDSVNTRFNKTIEISLYRILQEGLNNAVKYANAKEVNISLVCSEKLVTLIIKDNGVGFDQKLSGKKDLILSGNGITNMQERTSLLNGEFMIDTAPGEGTRIQIDIPLKPIV